MSTQRELTEDEKAKEAELNAAVEAAIRARTEWLDVKMYETSKLQVGDEIYDLKTGLSLGIVRKLYRFWRDRDDGVRDHSYCCDYKYETPGGWIDNTSSQIGLSYGTRKDALRYAERRTSWLQGTR